MLHDRYLTGHGKYPSRSGMMCRASGHEPKKAAL